MKILLLEDDKIIANQIIKYFELNHHEVNHFMDGESLLESFKILEATDICIFDINVPILNGIETLSALHKMEIYKPTIFLTALSDVEHIKNAYLTGCEDYIRKPFYLEELEIRIHKLVNQSIRKIQLNALFSFDFIDMRLYSDDREVFLSDKETKLLYFLAKKRNIFVSSALLIEYAWDSDDICDNTLRTTIKRLRSKLGDDSIISSRALGYKLVAHD